MSDDTTEETTETPQDQSSEADVAPADVSEAIERFPQMGARALWERFPSFQKTPYQQFAVDWTEARKEK